MSKKLLKPATSKFSQAILADLSKSDLTEQDALTLGWYEDRNGNLAMPFHNGLSLVRTRLTIPKLHIRNGKQTFQRYSQPRGSAPALFLPSIGGIDWDEVKADASVRLYLTEGEKKSAIACKRGLPCVGITGVDSWAHKGGVPLPQWDEFVLVGREVVIVFDSDIVDKPSVQSAERRLAHMLAARKAKVYRLRLSEGVITRFDDYLKNTSKKVSK